MNIQLNKILLFFSLQIKAAFRMIPVILVTTACFASITGLAAFAGTKLLYSGSHKEPLNVALVLPEDSDRYTRAAFSFINEIDTVKNQCSFTEMSEDDAFNNMRDGSVDAIILVPGQFIEHIMNGTNTPAQVILPKSGSTSSSPLFRELVNAGVGDLAIAQAGIYAVDDYCGRYGLKDEIAAAELYLNDKYLSHALDRSVYFSKETISSTGSLTLIQFYFCTGAVLLIMLSSISCISLLRSENSCTQAAIKRNGVPYIISSACRFSAVSAAYLILILIIAGIAITAAELSPQVRYTLQDVFTAFGPSSVLMLAFALPAIFSLSHMLLSLSDNTGAGIILLFIMTVLMVFLAGGLVPKAFLPSVLQKSAVLVPAAYIIGAFRGVLCNNIDLSCITGCLAVCILSACITKLAHKLDMP